ncbi:MAG TPA: aldo/keto reductase [Cytophagales bacterium]|nr:aldo/keto reductase [Cytophagales bacterium]
MEKVQLGNSDLQITPITFGAWAIGGWMWGGNDDNDAVAALHACLDEGITTIDTAPVYGQGHSEELIAKALKGERHHVEILTKFGLRWDTTEGEFFFESTGQGGQPIKVHKFAGYESVIKECEDSLRRLGTDYIDLLQIHWHDSTTPIEETMRALEMLIQQGKIRAAGVCNYTAEWIEEAEKTLSLASNQVPYSMLLRQIEEDVVPYVQEHGNGILAYSPLQRGVLTGKITDGYHFEEGDHRKGNKFFTQPNLGRINAFLQDIKPIADEHDCTLAQLVIRWTLEQPGITAALVGARNAEQVRANAKAALVSLSAEEVVRINDRLADLELD